ncbi:MAG TPA: NAD(P)-dependent oxidoreductase, partial [Armatimonadota bacterium]|nr:NAD(P)-dependent oxidoreductase [Armatimonadota bacterium]
VIPRVLLRCRFFFQPRQSGQWDALQVLADPHQREGVAAAALAAQFLNHNADLFSRMKDGATFINTARGALVDEAALIKELQSGRIWAVLDVTDPEPPVADSPFYNLPNVIYTPHIAGSMSQECHRMADFALDELERYLQGQPLRNAIRAESLTQIA